MKILLKATFYMRNLNYAFRREERIMLLLELDTIPKGVYIFYCYITEKDRNILIL